MNHTKTPWAVYSEFNIRQVGTNRGVASCGGYTISGEADSDKVFNENIANARFIVRAVNNHDKLVAALKSVLSIVDSPGKSRIKVVQALKEAEEK